MLPSDSPKPAMTELDAMQHWLVECLRSRRSLPRDAQALASASEHLTGNDRLLPVEQLEIYRVQFWLRHTSSLVEDFPGVSGILGQGEWERLVESYLASAALDSYTLRDLGSGLAEHIARRSETPHQGLCIDMARLEWAYVESFDAADAAPLAAQKLTAIPEDAWEGARLVTNPALRLLEVNYPVAALRRRLRAALGREDAEPVAIPEPSHQRLAVYRDPQHRLFYRGFGAAPFGVLRQLQAGVPLGPACEAVVQKNAVFEAEIETHVGAWFADWARRGFFVDVELAP